MQRPTAGDTAEGDTAEGGAGRHIAPGDRVDRGEIADPGQSAAPRDGAVPGDRLEVVLDDVTLRQALEAILIAVDEPLSVTRAATALQCTVDRVQRCLQALAAEYAEAHRGFVLRCVAGGWRFFANPDCLPLVQRLVTDGQQARLSQAALETLAVVAYRQPVSRGRVAAIRGVNVDGVMRTLQARGLVEEAGVEGGATLFRTTAFFLERLGLDSLEQLPAIGPFLPDVADVAELSDMESSGGRG